MKVMTGVVIGRQAAKTAVVRIDRPWRHPVYQKTVKRSQKYLVHDPEGKAKLGQVAIIREIRPVSKRKNWQIEAIKP
jgi:small subunit ribosomal protein S17